MLFALGLMRVGVPISLLGATALSIPEFWTTAVGDPSMILRWCQRFAYIHPTAGFLMSLYVFRRLSYGEMPFYSNHGVRFAPLAAAAFVVNVGLAIAVIAFVRCLGVALH